MNHLPTIHFLLVSGRVLSTFHILSQIPTQLAVSSCIKPVGFPCFFPTKAIGNIWMFPKIVVPLSYQLSYPFVFHYKPIHFGIYIYIYPYFWNHPKYIPYHQATTVVRDVLALFEIVLKATRQSRTLQGFPSVCGTTPWREQPSHGSITESESVPIHPWVGWFVL